MMRTDHLKIFLESYKPDGKGCVLKLYVLDDENVVSTNNEQSTHLPIPLVVISLKKSVP